MPTSSASFCQPGFQAAGQAAGCSPADAVSSTPSSPMEQPALTSASNTINRALRTPSEGSRVIQ